LTVCPQWWDIFVQRMLTFRATHDRPRIIDCGANVGLSSLFFARAYPAAPIDAYEADPALAALCRRSVAGNHAPGVTVHHAALWTANGTVEFCSEGADAGALASLDTGVSGTSITVPAVRLRDVLAAESRVDLLKVDIEGAEFDVLADSVEVLPRVAAMLVDVHEFDARKRRVPALLELLSANGFDYAIDHQRPLPWRGEAGPGTPFAGTAVAWGLLVRAWRP
jgi:FkbM family methyltransferase